MPLTDNQSEPDDQPNEIDYVPGLFVLYFVEDLQQDESNFVVSYSKLMAKICFAEQVGMDHDEPMRVRKILNIPITEPRWAEWDALLEGAAEGYIWKGQFMVDDATLISWGMKQVSEYTFTYRGRRYQQGLVFRQIDMINMARSADGNSHLPNN